jgi:hypothetical protein
MEDMMIQLGPYILPFPVALTAILSVLYSVFNKSDGTSYLSDRVKNGLALIIGMGFGFIIMFDKGIDLNWRNLVGWGIFGIVEGAAAVGLYKSFKILAGKN